MVVHTSHYTNHNDKGQKEDKLWTHASMKTRYEDKSEYIFGRGPRSLFNGSASWWMCHDSSMHLAYSAMIPACTWHINTCRSPGHVLSPIRFGGHTSMHVQQLLKQLHYHYVLYIDIPSVCIPTTFQTGPHTPSNKPCMGPCKQCHSSNVLVQDP